MQSFTRRHRRSVAGLAALLLVASGTLSFLDRHTMEGSFATFYFVCVGLGLGLLLVLAGVPTMRPGPAWKLFLVAAWAVAAAHGPSMVPGVARMLGLVIVVVLLLMAMGTFVLKTDITRTRSFSRL